MQILINQTHGGNYSTNNGADRSEESDPALSIALNDFHMER
jgi:hypothetical protein